MSVKSRKSGRPKKYKKFNERQQMKVAQEIHEGLIKPNAAVRKYGFCHRTIYNWLNKYTYRMMSPGENHCMPGNQRPNDHLQSKRVRELERALATAKLKVAALETVIEVAEKQFKIKIRKKVGTKQSSK
jgi:hypothetical protein